MRDQAAADLVAERHAAVGVQQVRLVHVHQLLDPVEPLLLPLRVRAVPRRVARLGGEVVQVLPLRVRPVVGHARLRTRLVGFMAVLEPGEAGAEVLGDAEVESLLLGRLLPVADDVALRAHLHGVPLVQLRVPQVEVVVVRAHADEVAGPGLLVHRHQPIRVPFLRFPQRDDVLVAVRGGMAVGLQVMLVLHVSLDVHVLGVPVAHHGHRLRAPVRPHAELGVAEPFGTLVLRERLERRLERPRRDGQIQLRVPLSRRPHRPHDQPAHRDRHNQPQPSDTCLPHTILLSLRPSR